MKKTLKKIK